MPESQRAGTTPKDLFIKRLLKAAGLSAEQAAALGKPGLTAEEIKKLMDAIRSGGDAA